MPIYPYKCFKCGYEFAREQRIHEEPLSVCPKCAQEALRRQVGDGTSFALDADGQLWRLMERVPEAATLAEVATEAQARQVGFALGRFHYLLADIDPARLSITLPGFHVTGRYLAQFDRTFADDPPVTGPDLARALASGPKLLFLDELASGLSEGELKDIMQLILKIRDQGITILMIEHIMQLIMNLCNRLVCIQFGTKIAEGTTEEVANDPKVTKAYLGDAGDSCAPVDQQPA